LGPFYKRLKTPEVKDCYKIVADGLSPSLIPNHERFRTLENKLRVTEGGGWRDGVAGCWVLRRACVVVSTGCYMQLTNVEHYIKNYVLYVG